MSKVLIKEEVVKELKNIVITVGDGRVDDNVGLDDYIMDKYSLNSIDLMDIMIAIREAYFDEENEIDLNDFMQDIYAEYESGAISINSMSDLVIKLYGSVK